MGLRYLVGIQYKTHQDEDKSRSWADIELGVMPYRRAKITVYDELMGLDSESFKRTAERKIFHEMCHLFIYPLVSFADNLFFDDEGKKKHLLELEEDLITRMEELFFGEEKVIW